MSETIDVVIDARWVIAMDPVGSVLSDHSVIVGGGRIRDIVPSSEARRAYREVAHIHLANHALIPGLINLHTHAAMTLMRGLADDRPLMDWLNNHIWPAEMRLRFPPFSAKRRHLRRRG